MATLAQAWPFVHPAFAGAALALGALPIVIHLINRRRFVKMPWAAMTFLMAANRRSARRMRIEQWLLLLTRIAAIALFALALARPFFPTTSRLPLAESGVHRVILLDNSLSMNARGPNGTTRFESALSVASRLLDSFPSADGVSLVTLAGPAQTIIAQAAHDRRLIRERLDAITPTQRGTDPIGAAEAALEALNTSRFPKANRAVYLISDLPETRWAGEADGPTTGAITALRRLADALNRPDTDLNVIRIAPGTASNVAITDLQADSALTGINQPVRFTATVTNFGDATVRGLALRARRDGRIIRREPLPPIRPGASVPASFTTEFSAAGTHLVDVKIVTTRGDALSEDDARYLSIDIRPVIPVLLVDGRPGATRLAGETGYLATALAPQFGSNPTILIDPRVIPEAELSGEPLSDYAFVALCDVQRLGQATWTALHEYVSRGGGLMIFGGSLISTDNYNRYGYATGRGLLPGKLGRIVDATTTTNGATGFKLTDPVHPLTIDFMGHPDSGLFSARVVKYLPIEPDDGRATVVLRFVDDAPAITASNVGEGRVLWYGTTANMDWNSLPARGDYVSLMMSAAAYLAPKLGTHRNVIVGESIRERLTPAETSMPLRVTVGGNAFNAAVVPDGDGLALVRGPIESAGTISVNIGPTTRTFTANVDTSESALTPVDATAFERALARPVRFVENFSAFAQEPATMRSTELGPAALYAVLVLLLIESGLGVWFGARRGGNARDMEHERLRELSAKPATPSRRAGFRESSGKSGGVERAPQTSGVG